MVTVLSVTEMISSTSSKGDHSVSSNKKAKNNFLIVNIRNLDFLSLLTVIEMPSSSNLMASPRLSWIMIELSSF